MKRHLIMLLAFAAIFQSCATKPTYKQQILDSLKQVYAGKTITITLSNNDANQKPITSQYAYVDKAKSDLAFKLNDFATYRVAEEEGFTKVETTETIYEDKTNEMVLIEEVQGGYVMNRGYVDYKYIVQFEQVSSM